MDYPYLLDGKDTILRVIDTVGISDNQKSPAEVFDEFRRFASRAPDGVDVFLFAVRAGRFLKHHDEAFRAFEANCGDQALKHTIIVFTHFDGNQEEAKRRITQSGNVELDSWLAKTAGWVCVESKLEPDSSRKQLHEQIAHLLKQFAGRRYRNAALNQSKEWRDNFAKAVRALSSDHRREDAIDALRSVISGEMSRKEADEKLGQLKQQDAEARYQFSQWQGMFLKEVKTLSSEQRREEAMEASRCAARGGMSCKEADEKLETLKQQDDEFNQWQERFLKSVPWHYGPEW